MDVNGVFDITVVSAYGVIQCDRGGKSDPYCIVSIDDVELFQTDVAKKTLSPVWNARKQVHIAANGLADGEMIDFTMYDHDKFTRDDCMGIVSLSVAEIARGAEIGTTHMLGSRPLPHKDKVTGSITLEIKYTPGPAPDSCTKWHFSNGKFRPGPL
mmetsp:Transcript_4232/g.9227  ORF Transcript_4232/g.9227 Transcript_4232/m.9227 type:complete len:156 (+) Transcript_4232:64-531(+)